MAARTRQLAQMAQQLMQLAGERDVAVGAGRGAGRCGERGHAWYGMAWHGIRAMCDSAQPVLRPPAERAPTHAAPCR